MTKKGTGLFGFADYTNPIIRPGYNRAKTDKVISNFRQNEQDYLKRIRALDEELNLVTKQRDATREAFHDYLESRGIQLDGEELNQYFEKHMNDI